MGKSKIYLFDKNLNLYQGRHVVKINNDIKNNNLEDDNEYTENEKEIEILINSFYGKEFENSANYYGEGKEKNGIKIKDSKLKIEEIKDNYYYNNEEKEPQIKTEQMKNFDWKLDNLLSKTENSFIVIRFPCFQHQVIYEEEIFEDYKKNYKYGKKAKDNKGNKTTWIYDTSLYNGKENFFNKSNPITDKILQFSKDEEIKLNPEDRRKIEQLLNTPDFIDLENKEIFWKNRYELQRNNTHDSLTKILNSVNWNKKEIYKEFFNNILKNWRGIEMCDILYILSRKFSVNKLFMDDTGIKDLEGLKILRKFAVNRLNRFSTNELNFMLLQLVQAIKYEDISLENILSPLVKLLIDKSKSDLYFASSFYWFIECESASDKYQDITISSIFHKIKQEFLEKMKINQLYLDIIKSEIEFKNELEEISKIVNNSGSLQNQRKKLFEIIDKEKKNFMHNEEHYLPIEPKIKVKGIFSQNCLVFSSAKRPIKYTFKMTPESKKFNRFGDNNYYKLIFKLGDDLRQDQLILQMINFMNSLLKKGYVDCEFTIYKVLATSKSDGFVEFVPDSKTYYDIKNDDKKLKLFFKDKIDNPEEFKKKLEKFIKSLAGYCAVNYILGIGDRHDQNIMIRNNGCIFHIDFGFILGNEPNILSFIPFKISKDMVDCMGGKDSENYKKFTQKCVNAYLILRENARTIVNMFYLMIDSGIPQINDIECLKKLHEQFAPGLTKDQAKNKFLKELDDALNSITSEIKEKFHKWKQDFL